MSRLESAFAVLAASQVSDVHRGVRGHQAIAQPLIHQRGIRRHCTKEHAGSTTHNAPQTERNTRTWGRYKTMCDYHQKRQVTDFNFSLKTLRKNS